MGDVGPFESIQSARARGEQEPLRQLQQVLSGMHMSLSMLNEQLRQSEVPILVKVVELLQARDADLADYLSSDSKGKLIPRFLAQLATQLSREQEFLRRECDQLARHAGELKSVLVLMAGPGTKDLAVRTPELTRIRDEQAVSGLEKSPAQEPGAPIKA